MNKFLLVILFISESVFSQVVSISPNSADYAQTLNTTITLASGVINIGSPPMQNGDIYLQQGNKFIYASSFNLNPQNPPYDDTINAVFTIPPVVPPGLYDVHVLQSTFIPMPPWVQVTDNQLIGGFTVHPAPATISGMAYFDANQNGIFDSTDYVMPNVRVKMNPGNFSTFTDSSGMYSFYVDSGSYSISVQLPNGFTLSSQPAVYTLNVPPDSSGNDFGMYVPLPNPLTQYFWIWTHPMRCLYTGFSSWSIRNTLPVTETGSITVIHSPNLTLSYTTFPPTVSGDTLTWNYTLQANDQLHCDVYYNNPAAGDTVWYYVIDSVYNSTGVFQQAYVDSFRFVVSCAVDPNDKHCSPEGEGPLHLTQKDVDLDYLINFQNTGTDTAVNVVILDTLDQDLNINSIQLLGSSDPVYVLIENRRMRFEFNNIMLPDSNVDEPGSHGYVAYRVKALQGLPDSTMLSNTAYIYFDFNSPVVTNTTENLLVSQLPVKVPSIVNENNTWVYPNPVAASAVLFIPEGVYRMTIYDINGQIISENIIENKFLLNNNFSAGVYYYRLCSEKKTLSGKFIVVDSK